MELAFYCLSLPTNLETQYVQNNLKIDVEDLWLRMLKFSKDSNKLKFVDKCLVSISFANFQPLMNQH
jgi:hypothetical protein